MTFISDSTNNLFVKRGVKVINISNFDLIFFIVRETYQKTLFQDMRP